MFLASYKIFDDISESHLSVGYELGWLLYHQSKKNKFGRCLIVEYRAYFLTGHKKMILVFHISVARFQYITVTFRNIGNVLERRILYSWRTDYLGIYPRVVLLLETNWADVVFPTGWKVFCETFESWLSTGHTVFYFVLFYIYYYIRDVLTIEAITFKKIIETQCALDIKNKILRIHK